MNLKQLINDPTLRAQNKMYKKCQTIDYVIDQWLKEGVSRRFRPGEKTTEKLMKQHRNFFSICTIDSSNTKTYKCILNLRNNFGSVVLSQDNHKSIDELESELLFASSSNS